MDPFFAALRARGIPDGAIEKMVQDKVDHYVVQLMDEATLSRYIPHFGDRVFAKNWKDSSSEGTGRGSNDERKRKLVERLRSKMRLPSSGQATSSSGSHSQVKARTVGLGNKNAARQTRKIELGWNNYQHGSFRQVRRQTGGGTRDIIARKDDTVSKILEDGKKIFFPKGKSPKGKVEDFEFTLCVMGSDEPLDDTLTIGNLYDTTHHKILRVYICSKKIENDDSDFSDSPEAKSPERFQTAEGPSSPEANSPERSQTAEGPSSPEANSPVLPTMLPQSSSSSLSPDGPSTSSSSFKNASVPTSSLFLDLSLDNEVIFLGDDGNMSLDVLCSTLIYEPSHASEQQASDDVVNLSEIENPEPVTEVPSSNPVPTNSESEASIGSQSTAITNQESSNHTLSEDFYENPENIVEKQTITIRTVQCVSDMIQAFSDEYILDANIEFTRVLENGKVETGVGSGLARDCLTDFWNKFYDSRTTGTTFKIPTLHHSFQEKEWTAVARIVAYGWQRFKYLPIQLAPPFLKEALSISSQTSLMDAFFNYISPSEKDALTEALQDFEGADMEELLTILSSHNCTTVPTEQNLGRLLEEIAHKELVQQPTFIIKCWKPVLEPIGESLSGGGLDQILADLQPKARSITKHIQFPKSMSPAEKATSHHLLRFIRGIDQIEIGLFLRFCTGSDLFLSKTIKVTFKDMSDFTRRPVAHTCGCVLELASTYNTYSEFRSEFVSQLHHRIWVMDMY